MIDLTPIFMRYEKLRAEADAVFAHMAAKFPQCVRCRPGCSDCCNALFDLSLVEAMYINHAFGQAFGFGPARSAILERAARIDRDLARMKKDMYRAEKNGEDPQKIIAASAASRMPCPLLDEERRCLLYEQRPITCRLYGIPQDIGGTGRVCGFSAFERGRDYPTVRVARFQERLEELSAEIEAASGTEYRLTEVYVPLSMALLTTYDDEYLGIGQKKADD